MLIDVVVDSYTQSKSPFFTYRLAPEMADQVEVGSVVEVPFGKRRLRAVVWKKNVQLEVKNIRATLRRVEDVPPLTAWQMALIDWLASYYHASHWSCLQTVCPFVFRTLPTLKVIKHVSLTTGVERQTIRGPRQKQLFELLQRLGSVTTTELKEQYQVTPDILRRAQSAGWLQISERAETLPDHVEHAPSPISLTTDQQTAVNRIEQALGKGDDNYFLLRGVTNSGKTEVYLRSIKSVLDRGQCGLLLVPEIILTPQTIARVEARFPGRVAAWHSRLTPRERYQTWQRIRDGHYSVVVGSRSALFLPFPKLGLIALDEEHEIGYKQEKNPRYQTRKVAEKLCALRQAVLIAGSATPTVDLMYAAEQGIYQVLRLPTPVNLNQTAAAEVRMIDLRDEFRQGNRETLSHSLRREISGNLEQGEQTILFLNRRGKHTYVFCRECGHVLKCPECELPLTYHQNGYAPPTLDCHRCEYQIKPPSTCPSCQGNKIRYLGAGTQQVVADLEKHFPQARLLRVDADTTSGKNTFQEIYHKLNAHEVDIVIGTQLIAKGWDLPQVSLVGVLLAEQSLNFPDYNAGERTFQLLTQVIGRAGRAALPGRVLMQSYDTENPYLRFSQNQDYDGFYAHEIAQRKRYGYPPFTRLIKLEKDFATEAQAIAESQQLAKQLRATIATLNDNDTEVLGPMPAFIVRRRNRYHYLLVLKGQQPDAMLYSVPDDWQVDVDPLSLL